MHAEFREALRCASRRNKYDRSTHFPLQQRPLENLMYKHTVSVLAIVVFSLVARGATLVDLEDKTLPPNSFYNGADNAHGFTSQGTHFNHTFSDFGGGVTSWEGWSYSNVVNPTTAG